MRKCIICNIDKEEKEFNKEHIIPDALGNKSLYFYEVCKECNAKLGRNIDCYLTESFPMKLIRHGLKLKSQNDVIPNPFKEGRDKKGRIVRTDGNLKPSIGNVVKEEEGILTVEAATVEEAKSIIRKKLRRKGYGTEEIESMIETSNSRSEVFQPDMSMEVMVDLGKLELAIVKIAYEYGVLKLGTSFYQDKQAEKIRTILKNASEGNQHTKYKMIAQMPVTLYEKFAKSIHPEINVHALWFDADLENRLVVNIILFKEKLFAYSVCISFEADKYSANKIDPDIVSVESSQN